MAKRMNDFRQMGPNELEIQEHELGEQIFRLRFQLTTGQSESVKKLREARRDLARVKTLVRQQELGQQQPGAKSAAEVPAKAKKSHDKRSHTKKNTKE